MKTTAPRMVKDTGKKIDVENIVITAVIFVCGIIPISVMLIAGLWEQLDIALGWAIFIVGCALMPKYSDHGVISGLVATAYSIALAVALWNQSLVATISIASVAIGIEVFQFVSRKKKSPKN